MGEACALNSDTESNPDTTPRSWISKKAVWLTVVVGILVVGLVSANVYVRPSSQQASVKAVEEKAEGEYQIQKQAVYSNSKYLADFHGSMTFEKCKATCSNWGDVCPVVCKDAQLCRLSDDVNAQHFTRDAACEKKCIGFNMHSDTHCTLFSSNVTLLSGGRGTFWATQVTKDEANEKKPTKKPANATTQAGGWTPCSISTDCAANYGCIDGYCRECASNADCPTQRPWCDSGTCKDEFTVPTKASVTWTLGGLGQSCDNVCASTSCVEGQWPSSLASFDTIRNGVGNPCASVEAGSAWYNPSLLTSDGACYWSSRDASCSTDMSGYKRFCPCAPAPTPAQEQRIHGA